MKSLPLPQPSPARRGSIFIKLLSLLANHHNIYEITHSGRDFLKDNSTVLQNIEAVEFEYVVNDLEELAEDKFKYFYNDLSQKFFDKDETIDKQKEFKGYKLQQTHKLNVSNKRIVSHTNKPRSQHNPINPH